MTNEYNIRLNPNRAKVIDTGIKFARGDKGSTFNLFIEELDTSNTTAKIVFKRSNGTSVESDITEESGTYRYQLLGNELAILGKVVADIKFYEGEKRISTCTFVFEVTSDTLEGIGAGTGGYSDQLERMSNEFEETLEYYENAFEGTGALIARGVYSASEEYDPLNMVFYNGSSWVCREKCTGQTPANGRYWQLLISGGGSTVIVDSELSLESENPVQNKVITEAIKKNSDDLEKIIDGTVTVKKAEDANKFGGKEPELYATKKDLEGLTPGGSSHTHENKEVLDQITAEDLRDWDSAYLERHGHENKEVIDQITEEDIDKIRKCIIEKHGIILKTTEFVVDNTYVGYPYKAIIQIKGVTGEYIPNVIFNVSDTGLFAPVSLSGDETVTVYASEIPDTDIVVPTVYCIKGVVA